MTDPYQVLHDNGFTWDDVNAIASVLAANDMDIMSRGDLAEAIRLNSDKDGHILPPLVEDGDRYRFATPDEFAGRLLHDRPLTRNEHIAAELRADTDEEQALAREGAAASIMPTDD